MLSLDKYTLFNFNDDTIEGNIKKGGIPINIKKLKFQQHQYLSNLDDKLFTFSINSKTNKGYSVDFMINIQYLEYLLDNKLNIPNKNFIIEKLKNKFNTEILSNFDIVSKKLPSIEEVIKKLIFKLFNYNNTYLLPRNDYVKIGKYWININNFDYCLQPYNNTLINFKIIGKILLTNDHISKLILKFVDDTSFINLLPKTKINDIKINKKKIILTYFDNIDDNIILKFERIITHFRLNSINCSLWIDNDKWVNLDTKYKYKIINILAYSDNYNKKIINNSSINKIPINFLAQHIICKFSYNYLNRYLQYQTITPILINPNKHFLKRYNKYLTNPSNCESDNNLIKMVSCCSVLPIFKQIKAVELVKKNNFCQNYINQEKIKCPVCLENTSKKKIIFSECGHYLCQVCFFENINSSRKNKRTCHICRKENTIDMHYQITDKTRSVSDYIINLYKNHHNFEDPKTSFIIGKKNKFFKNVNYKNTLFVLISNYPDWRISFEKILKKENNNNIIILDWNNLQILGNKLNEHYNIYNKSAQNLKLEFIILDPDNCNPKNRENSIIELLIHYNLFKYETNINLNYNFSQLIIQNTIDQKIFNKEIIFY